MHWNTKNQKYEILKCILILTWVKFRISENFGFKEDHWKTDIFNVKFKVWLKSETTVTKTNPFSS